MRNDKVTPGELTARFKMNAETNQALTMGDYRDYLSAQVQERAIGVAEGIHKTLHAVEQLLEAEFRGNPQFESLQVSIGEMHTRAIHGLDLYLPRGRSGPSKDTKE
jgi:hypothetical protein